MIPVNFAWEMFSKRQIKRDMIEKIPYALFIRSIMYVMLYTRLNVSYALSMMSKDQSNPCKDY
jgi:hypothetical protein